MHLDSIWGVLTAAIIILLDPYKFQSCFISDWVEGGPNSEKRWNKRVWYHPDQLPRLDERFRFLLRPKSL